MLFYIISYSSYKENLSNNQELLEFVVISFVLKTFMFDLGWSCWEKLHAYHF